MDLGEGRREEPQQLREMVEEAFRWVGAEALGGRGVRGMAGRGKAGRGGWRRGDEGWEAGGRKYGCWSQQRGEGQCIGN